MSDLLRLLRRCSECGVDISHLRSDSATCGSRCRQARWRRLNGKRTHKRRAGASTKMGKVTA